MGLLIECPHCRKRHTTKVNICRSSTGNGCRKKIPAVGRVFWVQYYVAGRLKHKKIGPSRAAAENFERKMKTEVAEGRYIDREVRPKVRIRDFVEELYRPWCQANNRGYDASKRYFLDEITTRWGGTFLDELSYEDLVKYQAEALRRDTEVYFNRVLATLDHMYTMAVRLNKVVESPIRGAKDLWFKEKSRLRYLTPDEVSRLLEASTRVRHLTPIVLAALNTGARKTELLQLRLGTNVDLVGRLITLDRTKNDETRHIPINDTLLAALREAAQGKEPGDYLFSRKKDGTPYADVKKGFNRAVKEAGIVDFHFHDLRHTFASSLVMRGGRPLRRQGTSWAQEHQDDGEVCSPGPRTPNTGHSGAR